MDRAHAHGYWIGIVAQNPWFLAPIPTCGELLMMHFDPTSVKAWTLLQL